MQLFIDASFCISRYRWIEGVPIEVAMQCDASLYPDALDSLLA